MTFCARIIIVCRNRGFAYDHGERQNRWINDHYIEGTRMKFFLAEGNIGGGATREQVDAVIQKLKDKGWHVEYKGECYEMEQTLTCRDLRPHFIDIRHGAIPTPASGVKRGHHRDLD